MAGIKPVVRLLVVCDDIHLDAANDNKATLVGVVTYLRSLEDPPFPYVHPELCVFLQLSGGRGRGDGRIVVVHADDGAIAFTTPERRLVFGSNPLDLVGVRYRIRNCPFPGPGLYWLQFHFDGEVLAEYPLVVR